MRASETVSEASPGSTASQTGVPTQVVQQVQGTQQVGCALPQGQVERACEGGSGDCGHGYLASPPPARTICSPVVIKMFTAAPPRPRGGRWHSGPYSLSLQRLLVQTSVSGKPGHVSPLQLTNIPVPQQVRLWHPALAPAASLRVQTHPALADQPQGHRPCPGPPTF